MLSAGYCYQKARVSKLSQQAAFTVLLLLLLFIKFLQDFYKCIPETNHVSRIFNVAAIQC